MMMTHVKMYVIFPYHYKITFLEKEVEKKQKRATRAPWKVVSNTYMYVYIYCSGDVYACRCDVATCSWVNRDAAAPNRTLADGEKTKCSIATSEHSLIFQRCTVVPLNAKFFSDKETRDKSRWLRFSVCNDEITTLPRSESLSLKSMGCTDISLTAPHGCALCAKQLIKTLSFLLKLSFVMCPFHSIIDRVLILFFSV